MRWDESRVEVLNRSARQPATSSREESGMYGLAHPAAHHGATRSSVPIGALCDWHMRTRPSGCSSGAGAARGRGWGERGRSPASCPVENASRWMASGATSRTRCVHGVSCAGTGLVFLSAVDSAPSNRWICRRMCWPKNSPRLDAFDQVELFPQVGRTLLPVADSFISSLHFS